MLSDSDLSSAIVIAIIIILAALCFWPGLIRVKGSSLEGYWASPSGALYELRDAGGRDFVVHSADTATTAAGKSSGIRGVSVPALGKQGTVELGSRRIDWQDGDTWLRQGVLLRN